MWSLRLIALIIMSACACRPLSAGQAPSTCGDISSQDFLRCVGEGIDDARSKREDRLSPQLRDVLIYMAQTEDYAGAIGDIDKIKTWSSELKRRDPVANSEAIGALDNAIASYKDELRPSVSTRAAAREALKAGREAVSVANATLPTPKADTNIYPLFVRRKLAFLGSNTKSKAD